jgi:hypothetical protein
MRTSFKIFAVAALGAVVVVSALLLRPSVQVAARQSAASVADPSPADAPALPSRLADALAPAALESQWAGLDAFARRASALGEAPISSARTLEIARLVAELDPALIPSLLAQANLDLEIVGALLQRWVDVAPLDALKRAIANTDEDQRVGEIAWMLERWGKNSLAQARSWAESLPAGRSHNAAVAALIPEIARLDRPGALALLTSLPAAESHAAAGQMFGDWARSDAAGAFASARQLEGGTRFAALHSTLQAAVANNTRQAAKLWDQLPASRERADLLPVLTEAMSKLDPKATVEWAAYFGNGTGGQQAVGQALGEWLKSDPTAAQAWLAARGTQAQQDDLRVYTATALAGNRPELAVSLAQAVVSEESRLSLLRSTADVWSRRDADGFWNWLQQQTDTATLTAVIPAAVERVAANNPANAAAMVSQLAVGEVRDAATRKLVTGWATVDPESAAAWTQRNIQDGTERTQALGLSLAELIERNASRAETFAASLPAGPEHDGVIQFAAERMAVRDPQAALRLAGAISDETTRHVVMQQAYLAYHKLAPQQADAWLAATSIPAEIKAKFTPQP